MFLYLGWMGIFNFEQNLEFMENVYEEVLKLFTDNERSLWMAIPFLANNYILSTDAHCMCIVPKNICPNILNLPNGYSVEKALSVIPEERNVKFDIEIDKLKLALDALPKVSEYKVYGEDIECETCNGVGVVEWTFKHYKKEHDCPVCDGSGFSHKKKEIKTGKTIPDYSKGVRILKSVISGKYISLFIQVAEMLSEKKITIVYQGENAESKTIFKISQCEILAMPLYIDKAFEKDHVFYTIK